MIQSETGTSDVHFEKGGVGGRGDGTGGEDVRVEESKIKGLASAETADGVSRQLAASDCSSGPCGGSNKASSSITTSNTAADPSISTASVASAASTTSATKTRTTATKVRKNYCDAKTLNALHSAAPHRSTELPRLRNRLC